MARTVTADAPRLRWGRALIAALAAELVLVVITAALFPMVTNPAAVLNWVIPPASLLVFIPAGQWTARTASGSPLLNGALPGLWGIALYVALTLIARGAVADYDLQSSIRPAYLLAHALKVVGGVIGGWLVSRRPAEAAV